MIKKSFQWIFFHRFRTRHATMKNVHRLQNQLHKIDPKLHPRLRFAPMAEDYPLLKSFQQFHLPTLT